MFYFTNVNVTCHNCIKRNWLRFHSSHSWEEDNPKIILQSRHQQNYCNDDVLASVIERHLDWSRVITLNSENYLHFLEHEFEWTFSTALFWIMTKWKIFLCMWDNLVHVKWHFRVNVWIYLGSTIHKCSSKPQNCDSLK